MPLIYLSPSTQEFNPFVGTGNEEYYMNLIANAMVPYLQANTIRYVRNDPAKNAAAAIAESRAGAYDVHLAIHSNAGSGEFAGILQGPDVYYYPYSPRSLSLAELIGDNLQAIYPYPEKVDLRPTTTIGEVTRTRAPAVLVEVAYHDNPEDADWIRDSIDEIARSLVHALTQYFGLPFFEPVLPQQGVVRTQSGSLNIRDYPSVAGRMLAMAPNGAEVTVVGSGEGWYAVRYGDILGYASEQYIETPA